MRRFHAKKRHYLFISELEQLQRVLLEVVDERLDGLDRVVLAIESAELLADLDDALLELLVLVLW